jgi:hypothetical protein
MNFGLLCKKARWRRTICTILVQARLFVRDRPPSQGTESTAARVVGAVGVEPTTNGLKDPQTAQELQTNTVTYKRISSDWTQVLLHLGPIC